MVSMTSPWVIHQYNRQDLFNYSRKFFMLDQLVPTVSSWNHMESMGRIFFEVGLYCMRV